MKSLVKEFLEKKRPESYYTKLTKELSKLNEKLRMFQNIDSSIKDGLPFSVKDNICVKDVESAASSKILEGYVPPFSATAVERLQKNGFGFIGKTKMDEFGFGTFGTNCEQPPKNPFNDNYVTGGSSGGAAAATAVLKYHVALSESTGGSIACPAAFCGVVGFTPTYGTVSRYGLIDYANSLDKIGVMARSASDIRIAFDKIKGRDEYDTTCIDKRITLEKKQTIFVINQLMEGVDEKIYSEFDKLIAKLKNAGYTIKTVDLNFIEKAIPTYYIISMAEASTNLAKYTGFKYGFRNENFSRNYNEFFTEARSRFGIEAKRRIVLGTFVRSASAKSRYYEKALRIRQMLISSMNMILKDGFILSPTMPIMTPKIEDAEKLTPVQTYTMDAITIPPNLAGLPNISFPYSYVNGMPLGAQLTTAHFNDYALLDFVESWEEGFEYRFKYNLGEL